MSLLAMMHDNSNQGDHDGMMWEDMGDMSGWMIGGMIFWLLFGLALIALAVAATMWLVRSMNGRHNDDDAVRELDRRYARGEISTEEHDERRQHLRSR